MDPRIRGSAWMGFWLATFQQLSGINLIMFYAPVLFAAPEGQEGLSAIQASAVIYWSNFMATGLGVVLLGFLGRRTLMLGG